MGFSVTTFAFELVNFVVLTLLLQRLLFRPLRRGLDARREALAARERAAGDKAREAEELRASYEARAREIDELREEAIRKAAIEAAEERSRLLAQAREDAAAERARAQRILDVERENALGWVRDLAIHRSTELSGRLLLELAPLAIERALLDLLIAEIGRQAERLRAAGAGDGAEVEITWARIPEDVEVSRLRDALAAALPAGDGSGPLRFVIREDAALLSGVTLRIGFRVLDASLAGQLDLLRDRAQALLDESRAHG
jgi:F-type H+-transporting ATPase subunit b